MNRKEDEMEHSTGAIVETGIMDEKQSYRRNFVGEKADVYESKFGQIEAGEGRLSWNWCAFLVTPWWFLYRKLYAWFFVSVAVGYGFDLILSVICHIAGYSDESAPMRVISGVIYLAISIYFGCNGDKIYLRRIDRCYRAVNRADYIVHYGETSLMAVLVAIAIYAVVALTFILTECPSVVVISVVFIVCGIIAWILLRKEQEIGQAKNDNNIVT